jgi:hypothetical protein
VVRVKKPKNRLKYPSACQNDIKMDLKEIIWASVAGIHLTPISMAFITNSVLTIPDLMTRAHEL